MRGVARRCGRRGGGRMRGPNNHDHRGRGSGRGLHNHRGRARARDGRVVHDDDRVRWVRHGRGHGEGRGERE